METTIRKFETPIGDVLVTKDGRNKFHVKFDKMDEPWGNETLAIKKAKMLACSKNNQYPKAKKNHELKYYVICKTIENRRCFYGWQYTFQIGVSEPWWRYGISLDLCKKFETIQDAKQEVQCYTDITIIKVTEIN